MSDHRELMNMCLDEVRRLQVEVKHLRGVIAQLEQMLYGDDDEPEG